VLLEIMNFRARDALRKEWDRHISFAFQRRRAHSLEILDPFGNSFCAGDLVFPGERQGDSRSGKRLEVRPFSIVFPAAPMPAFLSRGLLRTKMEARTDREAADNVVGHYQSERSVMAFRAAARKCLACFVGFLERFKASGAVLRIISGIGFHPAPPREGEERFGVLGIFLEALLSPSFRACGWHPESFSFARESGQGLTSMRSEIFIVKKKYSEENILA